MEKAHRKIQQIIDEIDRCIRSGCDEALCLRTLSAKLGYSEYYVSRMFRAISGMRFRDYVRLRKLAFSLKPLRQTRRKILDIAMELGFSSQEAFTRAFKSAYGLTPGEYRRNPVPVALRTILRPFDCYLLETGGFAMKQTDDSVKIYFTTIPAHQFLHIRNYESIGYFDFWQKQSKIPGQDCDTICGLLSSIRGKLDDFGGDEADSSSGQLMAFLNDPAGRICSWGIPLAECYGVRLPLGYDGYVPPQMTLTQIPEGEYIVFEHGPFDFETENAAVEQKIEQAMKDFDYAANGCCLDDTPGRIFYFYHDCERYWKYVRPVRKIS